MSLQCIYLSNYGDKSRFSARSQVGMRGARSQTAALPVHLLQMIEHIDGNNQDSTVVLLL